MKLIRHFENRLYYIDIDLIIDPIRCLYINIFYENETLMYRVPTYL